MVAVAIAAAVIAVAVAETAADIARESTASEEQPQSGSSVEAVSGQGTPYTAAEAAVEMIAAYLSAGPAWGIQYIAAATAAARIPWVAARRG